MAVREDARRLRADEVPVPDGQQAHDRRQVPAERSTREVLVHRMEPAQQRRGSGARRARRARETPTAEQSDVRPPTQSQIRNMCSGGIPSRSPAAGSAATPTKCLASESSPPTASLHPRLRGLRVLDRLERRHRLRDDHEERLGGIEIGRRPGEIRRIDVRDEPRDELGRRVRPQRLIGHRRAEVAAADTDVHDRADAAAGGSDPGAGAHLLGECGEPVELLVDGLDDVLAVDHERSRARHAERDVERGASFRDVDRLAAEHRLHLLLEPALDGELPEELHRVVGDAMLRVVEIEALGLGGQTLASARIAGEELAEIEVANLPVVPLEPPPHGRLAEQLSHARAPARPTPAPGTRRPDRPSRRSRCRRRAGPRPHPGRAGSSPG